MKLTKDMLTKIVREELERVDERSIGSFNHRVIIKVNVEATKHAGDRQTRHGADDWNVITDDEIVATAEAAIDDITEKIITNEIDVGDEIVIRDQQYELNLVCTLLPKRYGELELRVITVMRKKNFRPKTGSKVVDI